MVGVFMTDILVKMKKKRKIIKIGLAFSCQKLKKVPTSLHDKKLDFIITEKEILK